MIVCCINLYKKIGWCEISEFIFDQRFYLPEIRDETCPRYVTYERLHLIFIKVACDLKRVPV